MIMEDQPAKTTKVAKPSRARFAEAPLPPARAVVAEFGRSVGFALLILLGIVAMVVLSGGILLAIALSNYQWW